MSKPIIINERHEAERILKDGFKRKYINLYELGLLAKYFHSQGMKPKQIRRSLIDFCSSQDINFNEIVYIDVLRRAIESVKKFGLRDKVGNVAVTESELNAIRHLPHREYRVLFYMLVLAKVEKYNKARYVPRPEQLGYFVNQEFSAILKACGVRMSKKDANKLKYHLDGELGLISASMMSSSKWKIKFANDNSRAAIVVQDAEHILDFIEYYCVECGEHIPNKSKMHDMCSSCYKTYRKEMGRKHAKKYYEKSKGG